MSRAAVNLQKLEFQAEKLRNEKGRLLQDLTRLAEEEHAARVEAVTKTPDKRSDAELGSPVQTIRKRRAKLDRSLDAIEDELKAVGEAASQARLGIQREQLSKKLNSAKSWGHDEVAAYRAMFAGFKAFLDGYDRLADVLEAREVLRAHVQASGLLEAATSEQRSVFNDLCTAVIQPVSGDARAEVERRWRTCLDPGGEGTRLIGNQSATRTDHNWTLVSGDDPIYGDLRHRLRRVQISRQYVDVVETLTEAQKARAPQAGLTEVDRIASTDAGQAVGALLMIEAGVADEDD